MTYDIIIIGGGINGAAIARDAALRGMKVLLLEKGALGQGASGNSSKLAHGGLRYLATGEFALVRESVKERDLLLKNAADYVRPLSFIFPVYQQSNHGLWKVKLGLWIYDFFASNIMPKHQNFSAKDITQEAPLLRADSLKGGCLYWDGQMDDVGLTLANIQAAQAEKAVVESGANVTGFVKEQGKLSGVCYQQDGQEKQACATHIINVTGAWSNDITALDDGKILVAPTKGVHLVVKDLGLEHALILSAPQDGRTFFMIPWQGKTLIGTTDTAYEGSPDEVAVLPEDRHYLLTALRYYVPSHDFTDDDILSEYVGLRPLVASNSKTPSKRSRDALIYQSKSGLWSMVGGKYTTHRLMAEQLLNKISDRPCQTHNIPLN